MDRSPGREQLQVLPLILSSTASRPPLFSRRRGRRGCRHEGLCDLDKLHMRHGSICKPVDPPSCFRAGLLRLTCSPPGIPRPAARGDQRSGTAACLLESRQTSERDAEKGNYWQEEGGRHRERRISCFSSSRLGARERRGEGEAVIRGIRVGHDETALANREGNTKGTKKGKKYEGK
ncbi:hypothetical protein GGS23DRAFT_573936 [Durotheca rogersii]|uniref:uncharacterized protein n=1 Tax=Durotheca rogersii TaxID=419775 RepID=UPI002220230A|nr:uncharacterized protein GGS23DRAFT_573936 [Durotheca rogersii]KAI5861957.1 hypothetical protein GGS23DRAFT_573936 [Durotheca rogersii]